jgi:dihydrofolate reductase
VAALKQQPGNEMVIMGSSDLATSLLRLGLLDELGIMLNPIVLGEGKRLFSGIGDRLKLTLLAARTFSNGNVLQTYAPEQ